VKLKDLFSPRSAYIIDKIRLILGAGNTKLTDSEVMEALGKTYGLRVSRRSVNLYRDRL
jgi:DNA-directed RNA polymerase specialized sigma54-like protein